MLLSIVIPTKDRYDQLFETVSILSSEEYAGMETVIQDNSFDNGRALEFFEPGFPLPGGIKYFHCREKISVAENTNLGISNSSGEYVVCIGDDDCVSRHILRLAECMKENEIDACPFSTARFLWADLKYACPRYPAYEFHSAFKNVIINIDPIKELEKIARTSVFNIKFLPGVYHGIVSRKLLDEIHIRTGSFCPGQSPDIANAAAVSLLAKKVLFIDAPLSIAGACLKSGAGMGLTHSHIREMNDVSWLSDNEKMTWDKKLPYIWTAETVWASSLLSALKRMGYTGGIVRFNYHRFYANFLYYHFNYRKYVFPASKGEMLFILPYLCVVIAAGIKRKLTRILHKRATPAFKLCER
jgi:glycosyltransferase involved in cell wall biosynthesis